jgi:glycosyltransferase involved in cell wall biosynthesis
MEAADKIITVSNWTRDIVINKYGINPDKIVTVYNAVDPISDIDKISIRKGISDKIVTFLGRITFQKGPEYFVEAAYKVLQKMENVRFVMAGSGDMMHKMILRSAHLGISNRFHFTGFLSGDDVYQMYSISDLYVMPSVSEPFGISPLEAIQSNVPVIISRQSGVAEVLNHAIKIDFWDIDALADAIYGILNYPALSIMFKKYGKQEVDKLKWETSAGFVRDIYLSLLS